MARPARFSDVPVEPDTRITAESMVQVDGLEALHQKWTWEGIRAESLIFVAAEVGGLDDAQLETLVEQSGLPKEYSQFTIKRDSRGFTLVNFNFES